MSGFVVVDADVLGRRRTGDETYVTNLLRELGRQRGDLRIAAITRHPELVPDGIEPLELTARSQELRMAIRVPRLLRRLHPDLAHFQHILPPALPCPAVLTVHDLSFERDPTVMGRLDRFTFRAIVPRSVRRAHRVLAVSERTKRDLVELYGVDGHKVEVTLNGVDPAFSPGNGTHEGYALYVGAIQARKNPLVALAAAQEAGVPLVVVGPEKEPALARELRGRGADLRGYVPQNALVELYRGAAALVFPSRYEGFGLPLLEAMACGTPVVATPDDALREVAGDAGVYAEPAQLGGALRGVLEEQRARLSAAGIERAKLFSWAETARRTLAVYREVLER